MGVVIGGDGMCLMVACLDVCACDWFMCSSLVCM